MRKLFDSPHRFTILAVVLALVVLVLGGIAYIASTGSLRPGPDEQPDPVREVQERVDEAGYDWQADRNKFTDMTPEERRRWLGGDPPKPDDGDVSPTPDVREERDVLDEPPADVAPADAETKKKARGEDDAERLKAVVGAPSGGGARSYGPLGPPLGDDANVDYRPQLPPVRDQGRCGSCWAFACVGALEGLLLRQSSDPVRQAPSLDLSEQTLLSCLGSCGGYRLAPTLSRLKEEGTVPERCAPYRANDSKAWCDSACDGLDAVRLEDFRREDGNDQRDDAPSAAWIERTKALLVERGPLVAAMRVQRDFFHYGAGVYRSTSRVTEGYHAVLIVGYSDAGRYWIVRNSWGGDWGEQGNFRISWDDERSWFGYQIFSAEVAGGARPPEPDPDDPRPSFVRFSDETRRRLAALDGSIRLPCGEEGGERPAPLLIEALVENGAREAAEPAFAEGTEVHLYVNGLRAARLTHADGRYTASYDWSGARLRQATSFEVRATWTPAEPPSARPRTLVGDVALLRLTYDVRRTGATVEPLQIDLERHGETLHGAFSLPLGRYYSMDKGCGEVGFVLRVVGGKGSPLSFVRVSPSRLPYAGGSAERHVTVVAACRAGDCPTVDAQTELVAEPEGGGGDGARLVLPLTLRYEPSLIERLRPWLLPAAVALFLLLTALLVRRMILVDKVRYWRDRIGSRSPEDFWGRAGVWSERAAEMAQTRDGLLAVVRGGPRRTFYRFLRSFRWRELSQLELMTRTPVDDVQTRPLVSGPVRISAFEPGEDVIRVRRRDLPDDVARVEAGAEPGTAVLYPLRGFFQDATGRFQALERAILVRGALELLWGDDETPRYVISVTVGEDTVAVRVLPAG